MELRILDVGPVQAIYADDIAFVEIVDQNCRVTFCEKRRVVGERVMVPVFELIRPIACDMAARYMQLLKVQMALRAQDELILLH